MSLLLSMLRGVNVENFHPRYFYSFRQLARYLTCKCITQGLGMFIGQMTNKIIGFGVAQKRCVQCEVYKRKGLTGFHTPKHDCKTNHWASSMAMETAIACRLQVELSQAGARLSVCVGDGDCHLNAALNQCEDVDLRHVQRVLDLNHLVRNLFKALAAVKTKHYPKLAGVLDAPTVEHFCTAFTRVVHQHRVLPQTQILVLQSELNPVAENVVNVPSSDVNGVVNNENSNTSFVESATEALHAGDNLQPVVKSDEDAEVSPLKPRILFGSIDDCETDKDDDDKIALIDKG